MATRRPPSARRASADEMWRSAASATRPSTWAATENGGFISTTSDARRRRDGRGCGLRRCRVTATPGTELAEQTGARVGELVQDERGAGELGKDGEEPGAGRGLEHEVGGRDRRGDARDEAERDRRRELLERLALLGAARMGGSERRELGQHRRGTPRATRRARAWPARTCAGTGSAPPRRRRRRSSRSRRPRRRSRRRPLSSRREARARRLRRPRSRSASSNLAAATSATPASDRETAGATDGAAAIAAAETEHGVHEGHPGERDGTSRGALSRPRRLKSVPAVLSLSGCHELACVRDLRRADTKKARRSGRARGMEKCGAVAPPRLCRSFRRDGGRLSLLGIGWRLVVRTVLFAIGEEAAEDPLRLRLAVGARRPRASDVRSGSGSQPVPPAAARPPWPCPPSSGGR